MKKTLRILESEDKETANVIYTRFKTNEGWMSCFVQKSIAELKKIQPETLVEVETKEVLSKDKTKTFHNIMGFYRISPNQELKVEDVKVFSNTKPLYTKENLKPTNSNKNTTMYTSYAKDIFIAAYKPGEDDMTGIMNSAIELVKQAKEAFE